ncbi:MAG: VanW family protein, partial [Actinomycetota bacterium]|nr:VanW family protein [Actinomycetota bacterium]
LLVPLVALVLAVGAWALDARAAEGEPLRNVEVAGRDVGGLDRRALDASLADLAGAYPAAAVAVSTPGGELWAAGEELGLALDVEATRRQVLAVGREGSIVDRFTSWAGSLLGERHSDLSVVVDPVRTKAIVAERDPTTPLAPVEPGIAAQDGELVVVAGVPGTGLDPRLVAQRIAAAAASGALPVTAAAEPGPVAPRFDDVEAERLVERGRDLTAESLVLQAGDTGTQVPGTTMRTWLSAVPVADGLELRTDPVRAAADVEALLGDVGTRPVNASFMVDGDRIVVVPATPGTRCCAPGVGELAVTALLDRPEGPLQIPLTEAEPARTTAEAEALGIREPIASFTTSFPAGQSRVQNIHRISDLTRGVVIEPGGSFSVNDLIGRRTEANGFTKGGVIQNGVFEESVGGGISQFATTLFNAAFFGGLELDAYQSHSIYIDRYPFGREATLSYPEPDLVIENPSPHGVLIWPTYTPSSVTVTLYSTPWARGEQTAQTEAPVGACTRVTTTRTRTFVADGRTAEDKVFATYRPDEGVDC